MRRHQFFALSLLFLFSLSIPFFLLASGMRGQPDMLFPLPLNAYQDSQFNSTGGILLHRIVVDPMNLVVSLMFLAAIVHTFCVGFFRRLAEKTEIAHREFHHLGKQDMKYNGNVVDNVSFKAELLYLLGEIEIIFALWVIPLFWTIAVHKGWDVILSYLTTVNFTEPMFVVVIMTLASSRPIERISESCMRYAAQIGKGSTAAWWFVVLTIGPIMGSFITEPGAMTISAMLLGKQFYKKKPSMKFAYATIGLLFVNISVGGTFSHFAAPPVLMVAGPWNWDFAFMITNFGWKALIGILISNTLYFMVFKSEFKTLDKYDTLDIYTDGMIDWVDRDEPIPAYVTVVHILVMVWTVFSSHYPVLFIPGFFIFLGFRRATAHHQNDTNLKPPILVGAFLAGLVVHGGLQAWWIAPILGNLPELPLMLGATLLTAFNDNAAIAYLSTLVPAMTDSMKYAVVAGAVTGGGLTVIANAPNPAGVSILREHFEYGVSPLKLALGALIPTIILGCCFMLLP